MNFNLVAPFSLKGDQQQAVDSLFLNLQKKDQAVLLGATGTGKTFTVANLINKLQKPTLVIAHNKTLAYQLFTEFKALFPHNRVEYFVSNFDFYQPEAYLPKSDTYISKVSQVNQEIQMSRLGALNSLVGRRDTIVVASVAAIYGEFNPTDYQKLFFEIWVNQIYKRTQFLRRLVKSGYTRTNMSNTPKTFSVKGETVTLSPSWTSENLLRIIFFGDEISEIALVDQLNHNVVKSFQRFTIYPANDYLLTDDRVLESVARIKFELNERLLEFEEDNNIVAKERLKQITEHDIEEILEFHTCSGIENYSRHLELRAANDPPHTLIDYFGDDWLLVVDESHITVPQIKGMYNVDYSRKKILVDYGFRLKSALDNRPLRFAEFVNHWSKTVFISATPADYELNLVDHKIVEQIIRPTGLVDPNIVVLPKLNQINEVIKLLKQCVDNNERCFITTLTIRTAEELTHHLVKNNIKAAYLHNELKTLERSQVIFNLRKGLYDCIVGINLLREGLDVPEVALVIILDADKAGFLRNDKSLIQTIGRAARNVNGRVVMFADNQTLAMKTAINETNRRRSVQLRFNTKHSIVPTTINKPLINPLGDDKNITLLNKFLTKHKFLDFRQKDKIIKILTEKMYAASKKLNFEEALNYRDLITMINKNKNNDAFFTQDLLNKVTKAK